MNLFICDSISSTKKKTAFVLLTAVWLCLGFAGGAGAVTDVTVMFRSEGHGTINAIVVGDTITLSGTVVSIDSDVPAKFIADPDEGYSIDYWMVDGWRINYSGVVYNVTIQDKNNDVNVNVEVFFKRTHSFITFDPSSAGNGTLTATVDGDKINPGARVDINKPVVFTAVPNGGYAAARWTIVGADIIDSSENTVTVNVSSGADVYINVNASFNWIPTHARVTFRAVNGTIAAAIADESGADSIPISPDDSVAVGNRIIFTAAPDEGYGVVHWMVNDKPENVDSLLKYTLDVLISLADPVDVEAVFEPYAEPPFNARYGVVRVGPNPVAAGGDAAIYWVGNRAVGGSLSIFDATGNKVADVNVDNVAGVKKVGVWKVGGDVAAGVYLIKGVLRDKDGFKVKVSKPVGVVR